MTTFAKSSFDATGYLASRPTYPGRLYDVILAYHRGGTSHALDMGTGPGFMACALAPHFDRVSAQDPSPNMVSVGLQPDTGRVEYSLGAAEETGLPPTSVDLVVAGQAAHWFDHARVWPELGRILRPRGTVAYVGYGELEVTNRPGVTSIFRRLMRGELGPFWSQPGRSIAEGLLDRVPFPITPTCEEVVDVPDLEGAGVPLADKIQEPEPVLGEEGWEAASAVRIKGSTAGRWAIRREWTVAQLDAYVRTSSAYHAFAAAHPDDTAKRGHGPEGDVVDRRMAQIAKTLGADGVGDGDTVAVEWPLVLMMIRRE
ncbi:hypothetical protein CspeluHIS016_0300430 [Cutaneotrichosporon spelunceum]|uniref:Methyltransferase type 11 domain-containing protein n=1 Tax=Cutaneotrichosporon spelunceum TaxID=1672016 RepID=A0AAD3TSQ2_9TREE|nr:hypothetical protein CspeluHIS016_0300430 [Cutaneotrichosporon spelunceum]